MSVSENLHSVRQRIERAGGDPAAITIVAVTKGFGPDTCREALAAGLTVLGENRVQEAVKKMDEVDGGTWHLIGHLQTNKAKVAAERFAMIQSVDSLHLAEAIARHNEHLPVLVELNVAREAQKTGADPDHANELIRGVARMLDLRGLMCMGPSHGDPTPVFGALKTIRLDAEQSLGRSLPILSMGMSGDFEAAVAAGSTMLRLGQVLFGPRGQPA